MHYARTVHLCVFMIRTFNRDYFPKQHSPAQQCVCDIRASGMEGHMPEEEKLSINLLVFVAQKDCVLCEVENDVYT